MEHRGSYIAGDFDAWKIHAILYETKKMTSEARGL